MAGNTAIEKATPQSVEVKAREGRRSNWTYRPNVDVFDTPDELLMIADLPGANPDSIDVSVESGILTAQAEVAPRTFGRSQNLMHEYGVGGFHRRFEIDDTIDAEAVAAEYRDGCLSIHLPKARQARRRRIPVSS